MTELQEIPSTKSEEHRSSGNMKFRWKPGVLILLLGAVAALIARSVAPDQTFRVIFLYYIIGTMLGLMTIWWMFASGLKFRFRIAGLLLFILMAGLFIRFSIRDVYFEGDMRPRFRWKWEVHPAERTAEYLRKNAPVNPIPSVESELSDEVLKIVDADWPRYCGWNSDRTVKEPRLSDSERNWKTNPPEEIWRHPAGEAWSSFAVVGQRLYTQEQREKNECVVCYNADTGKEIWRREDPARYETPMGGIGPRATPTVTEDAVYALGATGILNCLNPITGVLIWQKNIVADAGSEVLEWGMSGSPLVHGELLIVDAGGAQNRAVIAYDKKDGAIRWSAGNHKAGYSAPRTETINGQLQLLIFHGDGLLAADPSDGSRLWEYPWTNLYQINVAQPILTGNRLFISSGYDSGCVLLDPTKIENGRPAEAWPPSKSLKLKFNEAVFSGGFVYGLDDGILCCIDVESGERKWKGGRYRFGQILLWDDLLLIQAEQGDVALVQVSPEKFTEVTRFTALNDRTWNVPVVCRGRLYVRNADEVACFQLRSDSSGK